MNKNELIQRLETVQVELGAISDQLGPDYWRLKPQPNGWNFEQIVQHLHVATLSFRSTIQSVQNGTYSVPGIGFIPGYANLFSRLLKKALSPKNRSKSKTFSVWEPGQASSDFTFMKDFIASQTELMDWIRTSSASDLKTVIRSPASGMVIYTVLDAFEIITIHQERHVLQARQLLENRESLS